MTEYKDVSRQTLSERLERYKRALYLGLLTMNEVRQLEGLPSLGLYGDSLRVIPGEPELIFPTKDGYVSTFELAKDLMKDAGAKKSAKVRINIPGDSKDMQAAMKEQTVVIELPERTSSKDAEEIIEAFRKSHGDKFNIGIRSGGAKVKVLGDSNEL